MVCIEAPQRDEAVTVNARNFLSLAPLVLLASTAQAQFRCDCTSIVASCNAEVAVSGSSIEVTSDQNQCSRVDYFVDGLPFVSVVVDGVERREWIPRTEPPRILVQSCQVCRENTAGAQPRAAAPAPQTQAQTQAQSSPDGELEPLISGVPSYPANAGSRRGYVELDVVVNAAGRVDTATVTAADPPGVFDGAAIAAVQRWRYPAAPDREPVTVHERVEFSPPAVAATAAPRVEREPAAGTPRNACVRQGAVYNYGDTVEVGLINACEEPLAVYTCAEGTAGSAGRWSCRDAETRAALLVAAGDARVGTQTALEIPSGLRTFANVGELQLARAPNTEYWWIACAATDTVCRDAARQWTRAIDGQAASVDPQSRGRLAVGRSY
jgi:TonB family protein